MAKNQTPLTTERIEKLLDEQTKVILGAVSEKLSDTEIRMSADVDRRLALMEERINRKFDKLTSTLDRFLKRMTDMEDEFATMKHDLNRVKSILKEKLGVDLS